MQTPSTRNCGRQLCPRGLRRDTVGCWRSAIAALAFGALLGCTTEAKVLTSSSAALTAEAGPLRPGERIVVIGRTPYPVDDIPSCVRDAFAVASPGTGIVAVDIFRSKAGGLPPRPRALG